MKSTACFRIVMAIACPLSVAGAPLAGGQEPAAPVAAPLPTPGLRTATVYLGQSAVLGVDSNVFDAIVADERVCSAKLLSLEGDPSRRLLVTGRAYGTVTVCVFFKDPARDPETIRIAVEGDPGRLSSLETAVAAEFPKAGVRLVPVPTSDKVIVKSAAVSPADAAAILAMVESSDLPRALIVDRMPRLHPPAPCCQPAPCYRRQCCR
jgi:Flp pilus assembly secretin CpaC